jgi:hypothetical protein
MSDERARLQRELDDAEMNLDIIRERKRAYVQETDIPMQLVREERKLERRIADIKERLGSQQSQGHGSGQRQTASGEDEQEPAIFMSYTRKDDEYLDGALTSFRKKLEGTLRFVSGRDLRIFQDVENIGYGQNIKQRISQSLGETMIFLPIITPSYFHSSWCREELELFLDRERQVDRDDLIFWIYYQDVPALETAFKTRRPADDPLINALKDRLGVDWRPFRDKDFGEPAVRAELERIARAIIKRLDTAR